MYPDAEPEAKVVYKEPLFVNKDHFLGRVFIREAAMEENTSSECIRTIVATCRCKILQLYEYQANDCGLRREMRMI